MAERTALEEVVATAGARERELAQRVDELERETKRVREEADKRDRKNQEEIEKVRAEAAAEREAFQDRCSIAGFWSRRNC